LIFSSSNEGRGKLGIAGFLSRRKFLQLNLGISKFFYPISILKIKMSKEQFSLEKLFNTVKNKINSNEKNSYSAKLAADGLEKITRKVGEEALEVVIASFMKEKDPSTKRHEELVGEICDLFFHTLVLMAASDVSFEEILAELNKRNQKK